MAEEMQEPREGLSRRALLNTAGAVGGTVLAASVLSGTAGAQTQSGPVTANRFSLTVDGYEIASFSELLGIVAEVQPAEFMESGSTGPTLSKLPGRTKPPSVVLKRGMTGGLELWKWHEAVRRGEMAQARKSCTLTMFNNVGKPVARYFMENAWPAKIELAAMKTGAGEVLMETVTLTAEYLQRVAP